MAQRRENPEESSDFSNISTVATSYDRWSRQSTAHNHNSDPKDLSGTIEDMKRDMDDEERSSNTIVPPVGSQGDACSTNLKAGGLDE